MRTKLPCPPDPELAAMQATRDRLSIPPLRPVGHNWRQSRADVIAALDQGITRAEALGEDGQE